MDVSVLIPARNEMFLNNTIDSILTNMEADTEVIVVLDGQWPVEPIPDNERVTLVYHPVSIGQRAATNEAAKISNARYVMKLDAHCSVGPGFDKIMIEDMQPTWTMVPMMHNLHVFDWVCQECEHRQYQGPTPDACSECGGSMERDILWKAKSSPKSTAMRFDRNMHFQYWGAYKKRQSGDLVDTMSILGACWMLERERYFDLNICDEQHGSWGQQGTEVACKTWLSGGRLVVNKRTWFAHMFRTQGGDFGFPYPLSGSAVSKARNYSKQLWKVDTPNELPDWDKAIHPLSWLIERFSPVPDWRLDIKKGIVYYTDNRCDERIMKAVQLQLEKTGLPIVSVSLKSIDFGQNIVLGAERGNLTMFKQILKGLEAIDADIVFFCEHDVLYSQEHFDFVPECQDVFYYNENSWRVDAESGHALFYYARSTSGLCAYRDLLLNHYRERVRRVEKEGFSRRMGYEPGTHHRKERIDDYGSKAWMSDKPNIDIRHKKTLTQNRWTQDQFRNKKSCRGWKESDTVPGWGQTEGRFTEFMNGILSV